MNKPGELKRYYALFQAIAAATFLSLGFYCLIAQFLTPAPSGGPDLAQISPRESDQTSRVMFWMISILSVSGIQFIKSLILPDKVTSYIEAGRQDRRSYLRGKLFVAAVVFIALAETPALLGLLLFLFTRNIGDFFGLAALSLAALIIGFPRFQEWEDWLKSQGCPVDE